MTNKNALDNALESKFSNFINLDQKLNQYYNE